MADSPDFAKGASGPDHVFNTSSYGLGLSPAYLSRSRSQSAVTTTTTLEMGVVSAPLVERPAAQDSEHGFFFATDNSRLYFSTGSVWLRVAG